MGLIGKLEDLPLTDIIQIVYLSRRTGILEVKKPSHIYKIYFSKGSLTLAVKDSFISPETFLLSGENKISDIYLDQARKIHESMPERGFGEILLEMNLCSPADLAQIIFNQTQSVIEEIMTDDTGEFAFELKESILESELGYSPERLFKHGGIPPEKVLRKTGEISVVKEIRDTLVRGKETFKAASKDAKPVGIEVPRPQPPQPAETRTLNLQNETALIPMDIDIAYKPKEAAPKLLGKFTLLSKDMEGEEAFGFTLCLLEGDPLLRVTLKRIFSRGGFKVYHYNQPTPFREQVALLVPQDEAMVILMGISRTLPEQEIVKTLSYLVTRVESLPPTIIIHPSTDTRVHRPLYGAGTNMIFPRPDLATLSVKSSEEVLNAFAEDLFLAIHNYINRLPEFSRKKAFHDIAAKEKLNRSLGLLKNLILELANPEDMGQVGLMTLRIAAEYLERCVILLTREKEFVGIGGFGFTGDEIPMNVRVRNIRIPSGEDTIFRQVRQTMQVHRGKMRRTQWNEAFLKNLGSIFPNEVILFPLVVKGRIIGFIYGDNAQYKKPIGNTDGLEIFLGQASYIYEDVAKKLGLKGVT